MVVEVLDGEEGGRGVAWGSLGFTGPSGEAPSSGTCAIRQADLSCLPGEAFRVWGVCVVWRAPITESDSRTKTRCEWLQHLVFLRLQ